MSSRVGSILVAITSVAVRIAGDPGAADVLAMAALGALTIELRRASEFQAATIAVRSSHVSGAARETT